ncbi:MAG: hypothetical protein J0I63_14755, partial [Thiobacillus sp.]|nr:hypothetical protein [Thiobacillus sp.]
MGERADWPRPRQASFSGRPARIERENREPGSPSGREPRQRLSHIADSPAAGVNQPRRWLRPKVDAER